MAAARQEQQPPLKKAPAAVTLLILSIIISSIFLTSSFIKSSKFISVYVENQTVETKIIVKEAKRTPKRVEIPLQCFSENVTQTCPSPYPIIDYQNITPNNSTCPEYFRWIHEDLNPFKPNGITREMVERAKTSAYFRLVVVQGKMYIEKFKHSFHTRDKFTLWGISQLLRKYPGMLPDFELMFNTFDRPVIRSQDYHGPNATAPPPLFHYCGDRWTLDIVFPEWSFWGWAEYNIKPWEQTLKEIRKGNAMTKWMEREPYAYWKGFPLIAETREDLLTCNVSDKQDCNARLFFQDWLHESRHGFKTSDLASQCSYRYKIYIEGNAWSVSEKYILACDSPTLYINSQYYDFFIRSLQPVQHYWPINDNDKCRSIKFAVDWGNTHKIKAREMGKAASEFVQEELKMDYVYDYMFHLLSEYANLLKFKPRVPEKVMEVCSETMACGANGNEERFMKASLVKGPSVMSPCRLQPPYDAQQLESVVKRKFSLIKQVEKWENDYWNKQETRDKSAEIRKCSDQTKKSEKARFEDKNQHSRWTWTKIYEKAQFYEEP